MLKHTIPALGAVAILLVLCSGAAAFDGVTGQESRPTTPVSQTPPSPTISVPAKPNNPSEALTTRVDNDLIKADEGDLDRLYQIHDDPVSHVLAAMALERLHLNLDKSTEDATACEKVLHVSRPDIAAYCALFAAGNARMEGHPQDANRKDLDIAQRYAMVLPAAELIALRKRVDDVGDRPEFRVHRLDRTITLQQRIRSFYKDQRYVEASANGVSRGLIVDTGGSWLVLDKRTAYYWGVHFTDEENQHIGGSFGEDISIRHGLLDRLELGGIVMENIPVEVVPKGPELMGINILKQLGAIRISKEALVVYGGNDSRPACSGPMLAASPRDGYSLWLMHNVTIDGTAQPVMINTGRATYLTGNAAAKDHYDVDPTGHGWLFDVNMQAIKVDMKVATRDVVIGGQPIKMRFVVLLGDNSPWSYVMGNLALQDMDFYFDFDNRHSCLLLHDKL